MTPAEKVALDQRARRLGLSTAEFVRRRVASDDQDDRCEEIEALLDILEQSAERSRQLSGDITAT